jgi:hypothetical protein
LSAWFRPQRGTAVGTRSPLSRSTAITSPPKVEPSQLTRRERRRGERTPERRRRRKRIALVGAVVVVLVLMLPSASLAEAMRAPGNLSASEKGVEWMRDHGLGGIVNVIEHWWFTNHQPPTGGTPDRGISIDTLPGQGGTSTGAKLDGRDHTDKPADVSVPDGVTPLPNEGVWQPVGPRFGGLSAMYATQVRPDSTHTSLLDGLVWIDPKLASFQLHPGIQEPGGNWATPSQIPMDQRLALLAAFNGGFRMQDAHGGIYLEGIARKPLRDGAASLVIFKDGTATVGAWGRDVQMTPDVVSVRQNLDLIVDNGGGAPGVGTGGPAAPGQPVAGLDDDSNGKWGDTLGNKVLVWRSAVCVDANGGIIYGYGNGLGALSLAQLMLRAGCVRAMELDINPSWTTFNFYGPQTPGDAASLVGSKLLPDQKKGADRYLKTDARDFIAVLSRSPK